MKIPFFGRNRQSETIVSLYGAIVAQARLPAFYRAYGVPDTLEGRFEMIVLHVAMALDRLAAEAPPSPEIGQGVFDLFCQDMDDNMREMGVGDMTVPKAMRRVAGAFYGRASIYRDALAAAGDEKLQEALVRNVFSGNSGDAARLIRYVRDAVRLLREHRAGEPLVWPDPEAISTAADRPAQGTQR